MRQQEAAVLPWPILDPQWPLRQTTQARHSRPVAPCAPAAARWTIDRSTGHTAGQLPSLPCAAIALDDDPLLLFQCPATPRPVLDPW